MDEIEVVAEVIRRALFVRTEGRVGLGSHDSQEIARAVIAALDEYREKQDEALRDELMAERRRERHPAPPMKPKGD